jgi:hypothetical protein
MLALLRPVSEVQRHGHRLDRCARIVFEDNPCAQRAHGRVGDEIVLVLRERRIFATADHAFSAEQFCARN